MTQPAARLVLLRLHQRSAGLEARERLSEVVQRAAGGRDLLALLTCHRVEAYFAIAGAGDVRRAIATRLGSPDGVPGDVLADGEAAAHLFRVACGLDSVILGEGQIANQVRRAYDAARRDGLDPLLAAAFQRALHLARRSRATTALGEVRRSIGSLAVDEALAHLREPASATALVVGAGEIGKLAARALARRVGRLLVANRDAARAREVAAACGAEAVALEDLPRALGASDVLISAADTRGSLLGRALLAPRLERGPLVVVDIAMPRSIAEDARALAGLTYRDVDHLAPHSAAVPADVIAEVARRCDEEASAYVAWLAERAAVERIRALREKAEAIRERQLARALRHLGHLSARDREVVKGLAASLTGALLHEPTVALRERVE